MTLPTQFSEPWAAGPDDPEPMCDICGEPQHCDRADEPGGCPAHNGDWNSETGCHISCEEPDPGDSYLLRDSESIGGGGARDTDPTYRREMKEAGRGALLR